MNTELTTAPKVFSKLKLKYKILRPKKSMPSQAHFPYINTEILIMEMGVSNEAKNGIPLKFLRKIKNRLWLKCCRYCVCGLPVNKTLENLNTRPYSLVSKSKSY
jgi:hypothetical protein